MAEHIAYDTDKRIIYVTTAPVDGEVSIDIKEHLYSDMKVDWQTDTTLNKFKLPIRSVGGDALPGSKELGATFFLDSNWKIRPYEANHIFRLNGNLYSEDGTSVMIPPIGNYQVLAEMFVSNLSDSTIQQLTEIEYASYNDGISIDPINGVDGTEHPSGTPTHPIKTLAVLDELRNNQNLPKKLYVLNDFTIDGVYDLSEYVIEGEAEVRTNINILSTPNVISTIFKECIIEGVLDGFSELKDCVLKNLSYVNGHIDNCKLNGVITLDGNNNLFLSNCSQLDVTLNPEINMGNSGQDLTIIEFTGLLSISNMSSGNIGIGLSAGAIVLKSTVTSGTVHVSGNGKLVDEAGNHILSGTWNGGVTILNETVGVIINDISFITKNIYINTELVVNGNGKESSPFNNISDAVDFAETVGWKRLIFLADATLERTLKNFTIEGIGLPTIDFNGQNVDKSEFFKVKLTGQQVGSIIAREVVLLPNLTGVHGIYKECGIAGDIEFADNSITTIASISTLFVGTPAPYKIDLGATNTNVVVNLRKVSGALEVMNVNTPTKFATFEFNGGKFIAGATNNNGVVGVAGLPDSAVDVSLATSTVILDGVFPSANTILNTDVSCV